MATFLSPSRRAALPAIVVLAGCAIGPILRAAEPAAPSAALAIEWVTVGDPGNPPDPATGRGAVAGVFQISKHEVTVAQYAAFLSAVAAADPHGLWTGGQKIDRQGQAGAFGYTARAGREREPVMYVSFIDAMRFANWLHHVQTEPAAAAPAATPAAAAQVTEAGAYDLAAGGGLAARSPGARAWIPSEDEWYKAAYHHPHAAGGPPGHYWRYPTKSDTPPKLGAAGDTGPGLANFLANTTLSPFGGGARSPADAMPAGSFPGAASHHGTLDQAGNAWEWVETTVFDTQRVIRGGSMCANHENLLAKVRISASPTRRYPDTGFRVARALPPEAAP